MWELNISSDEVSLTPCYDLHEFYYRIMVGLLLTLVWNAD